MVAERVDAVIKTLAFIAPGFINEQVISAHNRCMEHLKRGCLSDNPDAELYTSVNPVCENRFKKYKCARGTSELEGFHFYIRNAIRAKGMNPFLSHLMLLNCIHRW